MTPEQIAADVDRGAELHRQIAALQGELKTIEARLKSAALEGETQPLQDAEREGRQFIARGRNVVLPVIIESDQLIASFAPDSQTHQALLDAAGDQLPVLWREERKFVRVPRDGQAYRVALREHFAPDVAARILESSLQRDKLGIAKSRILVPWDRAKTTNP